MIISGNVTAMAMAADRLYHVVGRSAFSLLVLLGVLFLFPTAFAQNKLDEQKSDTPLVRTVKSLLRQGGQYSSGTSEKLSNRLGDNVSVGLLKIYKEKELQDPQNIRTFLPVIRSAFLYPHLVAARARKPQVTLPLLTRIGKNVEDPALKGDIDKLISFIKEQTSTHKKQRS